MTFAKGSFAHDSIWIKCFIIFFFGFFGLLIGSLLSFLLPNSESVESIQWGQFFASIFTFIFPAIICAYLFNNKKESYFRDEEIPSFSVSLATITLMFASIPVINIMAWYNEQLSLPESLAGLESIMRELEDSAADITALFLERNTTKGFLSNLLFLAIVPAISEELFFRGTIQRTLEEHYNKHYAIWITAFIFSAIHLQFFGFVPRLLLGALLGYLYSWSKCIYLPILAHFTNNALAVTAAFATASIATDIKAEEIGVGREEWILTASGVLFAIVLLVYIFRKTRNRHA